MNTIIKRPILIPQSRPTISEQDFDYLSNLVSSRQIAKGSYVVQLEEAFSSYLGAKDSIAVINGTSALHLALLSLGIGPGDEVILPSFTCAAVLHAINYTGATGIFVDIDASTWNPTRDLIKPLISAKTKAIIVTHTFGFPADIDSLNTLGVPIIEDCAHALGASYKNSPAGSVGVLSIFSFFATKMICSGEGGLLSTKNSEIGERARMISSPDFLDTYGVRYNYKMSDLTAGLALSQFRRLRGFVRLRKNLYREYSEAIKGNRFVKQSVPSVSKPSFYRFAVLVNDPQALMRRALKKRIICDRPIFMPLHSYFKNKPVTHLPNTEKIWKHCVSIPMYPDLTDNEIERVTRFISEESESK